MISYKELPNYGYRLENLEDLKELLKKCLEKVNILYERAHVRGGKGAKEVMIYYNNRIREIERLLSSEDEQEVLQRYYLFHYYLKPLEERDTTALE